MLIYGVVAPVAGRGGGTVEEFIKIWDIKWNKWRKGKNTKGKVRWWCLLINVMMVVAVLRGHCKRVY